MVIVSFFIKIIYDHRKRRNEFTQHYVNVVWATAILSPGRASVSKPELSAYLKA